MSARPSPEKTMQLDVTILGREYKVACKESERSELMQAVAVLDKRMREIRDGGKVAAIDRIAVMAALNLAHDLLRARAAEPEAGATVEDPKARRRVQSMCASIDQVLAKRP